MSRGFVKESDQEEIPIVPPRAHLPAGAVNYVTQIGYDELLAEREKMLSERENLPLSDANENRIALNFINAKLQLLNNRIATAKIVQISKQPKKKVRFGATVSFLTDSETEIQHYQIVGVDEADVAKRKIAFTSPIAKIFIDGKVGDVLTMKLEKSVRQFKIVSVTYPS